MMYFLKTISIYIEHALSVPPTLKADHYRTITHDHRKSDSTFTPFLTLVNSRDDTTVDFRHYIERYHK